MLRRGETCALGAAIALHGATVFFLSRVALVAPRVSGRDEPVATLTEEIAVETTVAPPEKAEKPALHKDGRRVVARVGVPSPPREPSAMEGTLASESPGEVRAPGDDSGRPTTLSGERARSPGLSLEQLGLAGPNRFMGSLHEASDASTAQEQGAADSVRAALDARDRDLGLGSAGPVIAELEGATLRSTAPANGHAAFVAVLDAAGLVVGLDVVEASSNMESWREIAATSLVGLKGKKLARAPGGRGESLRIDVSSRIETPSGRDPGTEVRVLRVPVHKGDGPKSARVELLDPLPHLLAETADPTTAAPVQIPRVRLEWTVLNLAYDPVDAAARPRRVVHAHLVNATRL
jgi:hypothetical protein